ncbi:hypothetical protein SAMN06313486_10168 [Epsilonproteobacteria bacterium SCGC AD-308-P11]|jgi:HD-like signal output (HDOD) protein|nr:hypothetical protein SAMN06313486_10168 [Epsilonproteobacteria bacterium SCGC AD-308-P11]
MNSAIVLIGIVSVASIVVALFALKPTHKHSKH